MTETYAWRTAKGQGGYAAIVSNIIWSDGEEPSPVIDNCASYVVLPTRDKAYRYARHMAETMAKLNFCRAHPYDKPSL